MGVVYYANYFVWFEVARTDLLRALGWTYREMEASGVFLPVIEAECQYRRPARYDDAVSIQTEGRMMSAIRLEFTYEVRANDDAAPLATGRTAHAAVSADGRPCRLPDRIAQAFA